MRAVVIGIGGIGSNLVESLCRTMVFSKGERVTKRLVLVDGDAYETKNRERQRYLSIGNKAEATKEWLQPLFPELEIEAKPRFIDADGAYLFMREDDVIFLGVDNHATRKVVSDQMVKLNNSLLISGGNDKYDGNVQIHHRKNGEDVTPPLTHQHPEIEFPKDRNPAELACGELIASGEPQLLSVNWSIASLMLNAYTVWLESGVFPYRELYFDLRTGNVRAVKVKS